MKLTIDTDFKTISVENQTSLPDFIEQIQKMLPDWKEYKIQNNPQPLSYYPWYPFWSSPTPEKGFTVSHESTPFFQVTGSGTTIN